MPITLELKAKHFKDVYFLSHEDCAVARAYYEATGNKGREGVDNLEDVPTGKIYRHEEYGSDDFAEDSANAKELSYNETVIRTIELIEDEETLS